MKKNFWTYLAILLIGFGALGAFNKYLISGEHAFGVSPEVPWGALIAAYVFFAVSATGTGLVASLGHVFKIKQFELLSKRALVASILLLLCAFGVLAIELSNPFKMIWLLFTPNFTSAIFWMGAFYGIYLVLLFAELFFSMTNNDKAATSIAYLSFIVKLAAVTNLGRVFGYSMTREFWYGFYYPAYMVITAIVSGAAVLSILAYLIGRDSSRFEHKGKNIMITLGKILAGAVIFLAIMQAFKLGTAISSGDQSLTQAARALVFGPMSLNFWSMEVLIGIVLPLYVLFSTKFKSIGKTFLAALMAMLGLLFSRLDFVYSGLVYPLEVVPKPCTPFLGFNVYSATWSEWSLILGAIGFIYIAFSIAEEKLKLDSEHE
jgi:molybdopterin-containing oxidoreductase family membrane subunit